MEKENNEEENSKIMRVHPFFYDRIENFIKDFKKIKDIKISTTTATRILNEKIKKQGGLIIE